MKECIRDEYHEWLWRLLVGFDEKVCLRSRDEEEDET